MQRRGWRYLATRVNGDGTETLLHADVPLENVNVEDVLSGDIGLNGTIAPAMASVMADDGEPLFDEWSTAIYAEADGEIRGGGILRQSGFDGPNWTLSCVGFTGYGRRLPYTGSGYAGVEVDPLDVVRVIWSHIQSQRAGNLGLILGSTTTGLEIGTELKQVEFDTVSGPVSFEAGPVKLNFYTTHDLMGMVDDLANEYGFDYHERHAWGADGTIKHYLDFGYPKIGRKRNDLRFVYGENVFESPTVDRDGETYASGSLVLGAGEGASMIHAVVEQPTKKKRLRRIAIVEDASIKTTNNARKRAMAENQWRSRLEDIQEIIVHDHKHAPLGAAGVGDEILLQSRDEWTTLDIWVRILAISTEPASGKIASYTVARVDRLST